MLGPILDRISLPLTSLTVGLFVLVVNGALLALIAGLSDSPIWVANRTASPTTPSRTL